MGELILLWPEPQARCAARIAGFVEIKNRIWANAIRIERVIGRRCNQLATCGQWCEQHAYKAEILRVGNLAGWPAASVNEHMTIGKGRDGWEAFAEIATRTRYEEFKPQLRHIEGTHSTGISYLHPLVILWQQELAQQSISSIQKKEEGIYAK